MKKIVYVDENTFEEIEHKFDNFHHGLAEDIAEDIRADIHGGYHQIAQVINVMSNKEGDKLIIGVIKKHKIGNVAEKYRITIEKVIE